jgi:ABC-type branched-subunit amino acid transport system substrate-binding protein
MNIDILNGINLIQTADFCNRNHIPMINPIMSNTALLRNNKFVYNAVSSEMSLVKGLAKYIYGKHTKDQVVLVKVGGKDEELYEEFRSTFSSQGSDKLYEVTDTSMLSVIKKDKKSIFVVLTRDKELATKVSNSLSEHIDRNKLIGALTLYGTKDWLNFDGIKEEVKKKIDFKYNSSIDFNSNNLNLSILRKKFKEKFKISLTKYAAQGYDVTFYFVKHLLQNSVNETPMMNVFDLKRIEPNSGFENGGSYVFGYENGSFTRIQILHD